MNADVPEFVFVLGFRFRVIPDDDAALQSSPLVCPPVSSPLTFPDNIVGPCAECGRLIQWRPHVPPNSIKLCSTCTAARVAAEPEPPEHAMTESTYWELRAIGILGGSES